MSRPHSSEWRRGWPVVLGAGAMFATGPGLYQNLSSLFMADLETALGLTRGQIATSAGLGLLGAFAAPLIGRLADRIGVVPVMVASVFVLAGAHGLLATMSGPRWQFQLGIALLALSAPGFSALIFGRLIARRFDQHRGLALGVATTGLAVATLVLPPLLAFVITTYGWRAGYLALGGAALLVGLPLALIAVRAAGPPESAIAPPAQMSGGSLSWRDVLFWRLAGSAVLINIGTVGMVTQLAQIGRDRGFSLTEAGLLLSAYALSQIVGRLGIGVLIDRFPANRMAALFGLVSTVGFAALVPGEGGLVLVCVAVFCAGLLNGAEFDLLPYFASRLFALETYGELYGRLLMLAILGSATGIVGFGWLRDYTGSYAMPLAVGCIAVLLASMLLLRLPAARADASPTT